MTTKLPLHEWYIVLIFCFILLALAGFALVRPKSTPPHAPLPSISEEVTVLQVKIEGQIAKPGLYRLPLHATIKELLKQAEPLDSADLSQLNWRKRLRNGQTIHIPERHLIIIHLTGAIEQPGPLEILSGTRYCELADQLSALPDADLKAIRNKKSFVKEGECIDIPFKKNKKKKSKTT
jgi:hypothetical protein